MAWENMSNYYRLLPEECTAPEIRLITDPKQIKKYGGPKMLMVPSVAYERVIREIPFGKLTTLVDIRMLFAKNNNADFTDPITAGKFCASVAWASVQRAENKIPYWRVLKSGGELNPNFPGGVHAHKALLEQEGHKVFSVSGIDSRFYVKPSEKVLSAFSSTKVKTIFTLEIKKDPSVSKHI